MPYSLDRIKCYWQVNEKAIAKSLKLGHSASGYIVRNDGAILADGSLKDCAIAIRDF